MNEKRIFAVFILLCRAFGLETSQEVDECFSWAVGPDWEQIPMSQWRQRLKIRGIHLSPDASMEEAVRTIINKWRQYREAEVAKFR